jgi:hypothetical protein
LPSVKGGASYRTGWFKSTEMPEITGQMAPLAGFCARHAIALQYLCGLS